MWLLPRISMRMGIEMGVNRSKEMGHGGRADTLMLICSSVTLALCEVQRIPSIIRALSTHHVRNLKFPLLV